VTPPRQTHWLRQNAAARIPRRIVTIDCEAKRDVSISGEVHGFRCGVAAFDTLAANGELESETRWLETECSAALWFFITEHCNTSHRTVVFAHNLSYDLRLSSALIHLPTLGYECRSIALTSQSCWAQFKHGGKSLWLCDSLSFIPASLEKIAGALQMDKPPLPDDGSPIQDFLERCRGDVKVTREGILRVIRYIKKNDLGDFRLTGSAQATAAFRHRFMPEKSLLVHDNEEAMEAERRAAWAGRAEVWRHGPYQRTVYEMDYQNAYARLAYANDVPTRFLAGHSGIPWNRLCNVMQYYAVVADVTISTNVPCVPTDSGGYIIWPVGEFQTTLWDHELQLAKREGAEIEVNRYWFYKRAPLLRQWAKWILQQLENPHSKLDPVIRIMLKDWARALIGRFGLRYSVLDKIGELQQHDLRLFGVQDIDTNTALEYLQIGGELFERMGKEESPNSTPFVMSSIMSAARVKLWELINVAGVQNVLYVDTDGILTTKGGYESIRSSNNGRGLPHVRYKSAYNGGDFRSPRNIDLGETRRVSGAPKKAERLEPGIYRGEVWESLPAALKRQHAGNVFVHEREFRVSELDRRRIHLPGGKTAPHSLTIESEQIAV